MASRREVLSGISTAVLLSGLPVRAQAAKRDALTLADPEMRAALAEQKTIDYSAAMLPTVRHLPARL